MNVPTCSNGRKPAIWPNPIIIMLLPCSLAAAAEKAIAPVQQAEAFLPVLLLIVLGFFTLLYGLFKNPRIRKKLLLRTILPEVQPGAFDSGPVRESDYSAKNAGIGTGVVKIFQQIKDNISDIKTLSIAYRHLLSLACEHLDFDAAAAFIINEDGRIILCGNSGLKGGSYEDCYLEGTGMISDLFQADVPRYVTDFRALPGNCQKLFNKYQSGWLLPLMPQGIPAGIIVFCHGRAPAQIADYFPKLDFVNIAACWFYENHRNQHLIARENKRNEMLVKTSLAISSSLDLDQVSQVLVGRLGSAFGCSYSYLMIAQENRQEMFVQMYHSERGSSIFKPEERLIDISGIGWLNEIISLGNPVLLEAAEIESFPEQDTARLKIHGCSSALVAPLKHAGKLTGVLLMVEQRTARRAGLKKEVVDLTAALVGQASAAIENARMYSQISAKIAQLTTMFEVGQALNSDLDLIPFFEKVLNAISRNFKMSTCAFLLRDTDTNELYIASVVGQYPEDALGLRIKIGKEGITGHAAAAGTAVNVGNVQLDQRFIASTGHTGSELAVPVILKNKVVGVLDVESDQKYAFSRRDEELLESLMDQVAAAIEKIKLKQQERERASRLAITNALVKRLSGIVDRSELLAEAVKGLTEGFGFDLAAIFIPDAKGELYLAKQSCRSGYGYEPGAVPNDEAGLITRAAQTKISCYIDRIKETESAPGSAAAGIDGVKSRYCLPLVAGINFHGVIDIQDRRPRALSQIDRSALQTIADFLGVTLNNISLYRETIDKAERLSLVGQINQAISATLDIKDLFDRIVKSLAEVTGYRWVTLVFKEPLTVYGGGEYLRSHSQTIEEIPTIDCLGQCFEEVAKSGKSAYYDIDRLALTDPLKSYFYKNGISHLAISPIRREQKTPGYLMVGNPNPEGFRPQDHALLRDVSQHLEIALNNAMLYSELKAAYHRLGETQEKLIQSEKFKALGEVAAGIAHDFKNILAAIGGRVQMLTLAKKQNHDIPESMLIKSLDVIEKSATDGVHILSRINEFTKGRQKRKHSAIRLSEIIEDTKEMTRSNWENPESNKRISILTDYAGDDLIMGDRAEIVEVLSNLIINAVDAIKEDGTIRINTRTAKAKIIVTVQDDGEGIDQKILKRIFDPFFTTKERLGTGLGLAMVYAIVDRHDGEISVDSSPGKGALFTIKFPRVDALSVTKRPAVLIVEDDPNLREAMNELIEELGGRAALAAGYAEAESLIKAESFDMVLTDLGLSGKSGWEVIDLVKAKLPNCLIVPMTGWQDDLNSQELRSKGLSEVLAKPFDINQVQQLFNKIKNREKDASRVT